MGCMGPALRVQPTQEPTLHGARGNLTHHNSRAYAVATLALPGCPRSRNARKRYSAMLMDTLGAKTRCDVTSLSLSLATEDIVLTCIWHVAGVACFLRGRISPITNDPRWRARYLNSRIAWSRRRANVRSRCASSAR